MARSNANLASVEPTPEAPYGFKADGTPRKRPSREGEKRRQKDIRVLYYARDDAGNKVPGVRIEWLYTGKDSDEFADALTANPDALVGKLSLAKAEPEAE